MAAWSSPGELSARVSHSYGYKYFMYLRADGWAVGGWTQRIVPPPPRSSLPRPIQPLLLCSWAHALCCPHWVRSVKAAEVMVVGKLRPRVTSLHTFRLMTSTRPPLAVTRRNNAYRSNTCFAMMGTRFTGVPVVKWVENQDTKIRPRLRSSQGTEGYPHEAWVRTRPTKGLKGGVGGRTGN